MQANIESLSEEVKECRTTIYDYRVRISSLEKQKMSLEALCERAEINQTVQSEIVVQDSCDLQNEVEKRKQIDDALHVSNQQLSRMESLELENSKLQHENEKFSRLVYTFKFILEVIFF